MMTFNLQTQPKTYKYMTVCVCVCALLTRVVRDGIVTVLRSFRAMCIATSLLGNSLTYQIQITIASLIIISKIKYYT